MGVRMIQAGLGGWGRNWQEEVAPAVPDVEFVGFVDTAAETLEMAARQLSLSPDVCFTDLAAAMNAVEAEGVLITAPIPAHLPLAVEALKAGKHVLTEKPFGPTAAEAREVADLAERLGLTLAVSQNYRYYPGPRTALRILESSELGPLGNVQVDFRKWWNDRDKANPHFRVPHVLLYDMAIHHFDLMRMLVRDEPVEVYTKLTDPPWSNFESEAAATVIVSFAGGTTVSYRGNWVSSGVPTPWSGRWHLECEKGEIAWSGPNLLMAAPDDPDGHESVRIRRHATTFDDAYPGYRDVPLDPVPHLGRAGTLMAFVTAIRTGIEAETSGRRNLPTLALCEAAVRSGETGRPIALI